MGSTLSHSIPVLGALRFWCALYIYLLIVEIFLHSLNQHLQTYISLLSCSFTFYSLSFSCTIAQQKFWHVQATPVRMEQLVLITMVSVVMRAFVLLASREPTVKLVLVLYHLSNDILALINEYKDIYRAWNIHNFLAIFTFPLLNMPIKRSLLNWTISSYTTFSILYLFHSFLSTFSCAFSQQKSWHVPATPVRTEQLVLITMVVVAMSVSVLLASREHTVIMVLCLIPSFLHTCFDFIATYLSTNMPIKRSLLNGTIPSYCAFSILYLFHLFLSTFSCAFSQQKSWHVQATPVRMEQLVLITMVAVVMSVSVLLALREQTVKMVHVYTF